MADTAIKIIIRISEKSSILGAAWLEKYEHIFMIKLRETKHFQTNFPSKILKIARIFKILIVLLLGKNYLDIRFF